MDETRIDKENDVGDWCFLPGSESGGLLGSQNHLDVEGSNNGFLKAQNKQSKRDMRQFD
ncbi:hypothetical protein L195_g059746 [Trifolium pratense]|uniref:Uncharacterized protein n=1 Tax=Trifolium pratense TaxID=57577 RepID=A0A2K3JZV9_TRIPR|nr:hypothetical protein L195_g059746 [Trifolium pratense]